MGVFEKLGNKFVITTELGPTSGTDVKATLEKAGQYIHLDGINIHDCPGANMRINAIALACIVQSELGIDTIPHFTCRDRSLLGTQADLLGAHALGIRYILATTGDHPQHGPFPGSSAVYDLQTLDLIRLIKQMNKGLDANKKEFKGPTSFYVSATAAPVAANMDAVYSRVRRKIEAGADFFQTQPVYDIEKAVAFAQKMKELQAPVILGVMPLKSLKMAEYMRDYVEGVEIPEEVIQRMKEPGTPGVNIVCELVEQVYKYVDGIHIMAMGDVRASNVIIEKILSLGTG